MAVGTLVPRVLILARREVINDRFGDAGDGVGHRPVQTESFLEADGLDPHVGAIEDLARDGKHGDTGGVGELEHSTDDLAVERLGVDEPLPCDHEVGLSDRGGEAERFRNDVEAVDEPCADGGQSTGEPTGRTGTLERSDIDAAFVRPRSGEHLEATGQQFHLGRRGAFLGAEDRSRIDEGRPHVAGDPQVDASQLLHGPDGLERPESAVGGGRATHSDDDRVGAAVDRLGDEFADPAGGGGERVVAVAATGDHQSGGLRHLDDRPVLVESPLGLDRLTERAGHGRRSIGAAERGQRALAAIGHRHRLHRVAERRGRRRDRIRDGVRGGGALELVWGRKDAHDPILGASVGAAPLPKRSLVRYRWAMAIDVDGHDTLVASMTGGMTPSGERPFAGSDVLREDGRPLPEFRAELRKMRRDVTGVSAYRILKPRFTGLLKRKYLGLSLRFFLGQAIVVAMFVAAGAPTLYVWIWLLPYLTIYQLGNRLRSIAEHGGMTRSDDRRDTTHHVEQHALARLLMTPYGVGYHLAHHVDSGVPFRNLPKLHRALADGGYLTGASTWPNYTSLWKALILR